MTKASNKTEDSKGVAELDFDQDALRDVREKYRQEREKRLRPDGVAQYIEVKGDFSRYVDDPYVDPNFTRAPVNEEVKVLIGGGGFAGLSVGAQLRLAGVQNLRIIEKGGDFGGAWYWNRYPGAQCDIESYCYLPLLEETNYIPKEKYSFRPEIFEHAQRIARKFDLYKDALLQTQITELRWLEEESSWLVRTNRDDVIKAKFVVQTNGPLDRPKLPGVPGIEKFKGYSFHTSRWDYDYTGGDTTGGLTKLADKRVAIFGTGATGIQSIPYLGKYAKHLYVIQRTPASVDERRNAPTDSAWVKSLKPGWQKERRRNFVALTSGVPQDVDLVGDGWTDAVRSVGGFFQAGTSNASPEEMARVMEFADLKKMNQIRARVESIVKDKATAEALKPWYRQFCKRPAFNDDYLDTFNRPNVTVVDTNGRGPDAITETGIVVHGKEYAVDCIIFATGFEVGTAYARRMGFETYGRGGKSLSKEWANGSRSLHGFYCRDFPNLLHMGVNQNGVSYCVTYGLDEQAVHIAAILKYAQLRQARLIEPSEEAEKRWVATIRKLSGKTREFLQQCTPSYNNSEGSNKSVTLLDEVYGGGAIEFYDLIRRWREDSKMEGLNFT
jgi:cation diffusion facilitator CzcD-associated flavoprotein CzcO